jgi:hypothetical protein
MNPSDNYANPFIEFYHFQLTISLSIIVPCHPKLQWDLTNNIYQKIAPSAVARDLARIAGLYLAAPATSAPSDRIWSRESRILLLKEPISQQKFLRE